MWHRFLESLFSCIFSFVFSVYIFKPGFGHGGPRDEYLTSGTHTESEPQCKRNKWSTFSVYNMALGWSAYNVSLVKLKCMRISQKVSCFQFMVFPALHQVVSLGVCSWIRFSALHQASHCSFSRHLQSPCHTPRWAKCVGGSSHEAQPCPVVFAVFGVNGSLRHRCRKAWWRYVRIKATLEIDIKCYEKREERWSGMEVGEAQADFDQIHMLSQQARVMEDASSHCLTWTSCSPERGQGSSSPNMKPHKERQLPEMAKRSIIASELASSDSQSRKGNWACTHYDPHGVGDLRHPWACGDRSHGFEWSHVSRCWCVCWARVSCVNAFDSLCGWTSIQGRMWPLWEVSWLWNSSPGWLLWPQSTQLWASAKIRKTTHPLALFDCPPVPSSPS